MGSSSIAGRFWLRLYVGAAWECVELQPGPALPCSAPTALHRGHRLQVLPGGVDALPAAHPGTSWEAARSAGPQMSPGDAALIATAAGLVAWHRDALHSGASGARTVSQQGGWARVCSASGSKAFPRIDPAIITLVTAGDWALLGRKSGWPDGRWGWGAHVGASGWACDCGWACD